MGSIMLSRGAVHPTVRALKEANLPCIVGNRPCGQARQLFPATGRAPAKIECCASGTLRNANSAAECGERV